MKLKNNSESQYMNLPGIIVLSLIAIAIAGILMSQWKKKSKLKDKLNEKFAETWREILLKKVAFYAGLNDPDKALFERRVKLFLATKTIEGVETDIDDTIRLLVASSTIIPTFAFPKYNYSYVHEVLIYPNSFDEKYQTERYIGNKEMIIGMVGSRFQDGTVILSKPDLLADFDGSPHRSNVGIHEFVHLLDRADGDIDGIPSLLLEHRYIAPWLHEIKNEMRRIEEGKSDISPYALTNNAEFLAVASEYFFNNPEKFKVRHPELYERLDGIFKNVL